MTVKRCASRPFPEFARRVLSAQPEGKVIFEKRQRGKPLPRMGKRHQKAGTGCPVPAGKAEPCNYLVPKIRSPASPRPGTM